MSTNNPIRTYAIPALAVAAIVGLGYIAYKGKKTTNTETATASSLNSTTDTTGVFGGNSMAGTDSTGLYNDLALGSNTTAADNSTSTIGGTVPDTYSSTDAVAAPTSTKKAAKNITTADPDEANVAPEPTATKKSNTKKKSGQGDGLASKGATSTKAVAKKEQAKGDKGDFWVIAGGFATQQGAEAQVAKLKKLGFKNATAVKFEGNTVTSAVAGKYPSKAVGDIGVKTLGKNKVEAFVKKVGTDTKIVTNAG